MWRKKLSYEKTWADFKKLFAEEYHDLFELECINVTQSGFRGLDIAIIIQENIVAALDNLAMDITS